MKKEKLPEVIITYIVLITVSVLFFFPILWLVLASFSGSGSIYDFQGFFPQSYSGETYHKLFMDTQMYDYPRWLLNTLFVSAFSCLLLNLLICHTILIIIFYIKNIKNCSANK